MYSEMTISYSIFCSPEVIQSIIKTESPENYNSLDFSESFGISPLQMFQQKQAYQLSLLYLYCEKQQNKKNRRSIKKKIEICKCL